jgi:hypothetical protein
MRSCIPRLSQQEAWRTTTGSPEGVKIHFTTNLAEAQPNGIKSSISDAYATSSCSISQMSALTTPHDTPKHNYTYSVEESGVSKARKKVSYFCGKMNSDTPWWGETGVSSSGITLGPDRW